MTQYDDSHTKSIELAIDVVLNRTVTQLLTDIDDVGRLIVVGIQTRGVPIAHRICKLIVERTGICPEMGSLDITLYRDDVFQQRNLPRVGVTQIRSSLEGMQVLLVDDVLFTGRTIRAALDALMDFGRPDWIRLCVLIDRGHRELPIQADYCGQLVETTRLERVEVRLKEVDGIDAYLIHRDDKEL